MENYQLKPFKSQSTIDYGKDLNAQQFKVATATNGACLVLAGAGSGKTRVLIYRLAYLLDQGINPENILLVTFTNKASIEMVNRAETVLKSDLSKLWAGTFHHIGNVILRKEAHLLGYTPSFTIIDREDSLGYIADCMSEAGYSDKGTLFPKKDILSTIWNLAVNAQKEVKEIILNSYPKLEEFIEPIKRILNLYNHKKIQSNIMDFSDLLNNWLKVLKNDFVRDKYSDQFKYILVDEYQDTNQLQFELLNLLASKHKNILAVGDDAQSIYSFRSAQINNILDFPKVFPETKIFKLELNYRSSPQILDLANEIIKHNINQFPKTLRAVKEDNEKPRIVKTKDVYQQAQFIGQKILEFYQDDIPLNQIAVLFRSRFQSLELEVELMKRGIPYIVRGGVRFFEQAHIKDALAYLRIIVNPKDELSYKRVLCLQKGLGRTFAHKIWQMIFNERPFSEIENSLPKRPKQGFRNFRLSLEAIKKMTTAEEALNEILSFYKEHCYLSFDNPEERILDLEELSKMARSYSGIKQFLLEFNAFEEFKGETRIAPGEREEVLVLSTIHQSKGLEWEAVFLIGFNNYEFPHPKALNSQDQLEEERRLFYVAATRAKVHLYISYPETKYTFKNGLIVTQPSMFFYDLPLETYEEVNVIEPSFDFIDPVI